MNRSFLAGCPTRTMSALAAAFMSMAPFTHGHAQSPAPSGGARPPAAAAASRLPVGETPCVRIQEIALRGPEAGRFGWLLNEIAGSQADDSPLRKCVGAAGVGIVLQRAATALQARGFVTTSVQQQPAELASGTLALTVVPGRIRSIRIADFSRQKVPAWNNVPASPGDIVNLKDLEQALQATRLVPTVRAHVRIEPVQGGEPGESDVLITHQIVKPASP